MNPHGISSSDSLVAAKPPRQDRCPTSGAFKTRKRARAVTLAPPHIVVCLLWLPPSGSVNQKPATDHQGASAQQRNVADRDTTTTRQCLLSTRIVLYRVLHATITRRILHSLRLLVSLFSSPVGLFSGLLSSLFIGLSHPRASGCRHRYHDSGYCENNYDTSQCTTPFFDSGLSSPTVQTNTTRLTCCI